MGDVEQALARGEGLRGLLGWVGSDVIDPEGRHIGRLAGIAVDRQDGSIRWLVVRGRRDRFIAVPPWNITAGARRLSVPWSAALIARTPVVPSDCSFSARLERELCGAYRIEPTRGATLSRWERRRTTAMAVAAAGNQVVWEPPARHDGDRRLEAEAPPAPTLATAPAPAPAPAPATAPPRPAPPARPLAAAAPLAEQRGTQHARLGSVMVASQDGGLRSAVREAIEREARVVVAAEVADGRSASHNLTSRYLDAAVLDFGLPGLPAIDVVGRAIRDRLPTRFVILVHSQADRRSAERAVRDMGVVVPVSSGAAVVAAAAADLAAAVAAARPG